MSIRFSNLIVFFFGFFFQGSRWVSGLLSTTQATRMRALWQFTAGDKEVEKEQNKVEREREREREKERANQRELDTIFFLVLLTLPHFFSNVKRYGLELAAVFLLLSTMCLVSAADRFEDEIFVATRRVAFASFSVLCEFF